MAARHESPEQTEARHNTARSFTSRIDPDGMVVGIFRLPPLQAGRLLAADDAQVLRRTPDAFRGRVRENGGAWPSVAQQRGDALVELIAEGGAHVETELVVHVRGDGCTLDDGTPIAGSVVERLVPEAFLRALIHDAERRPINASGRHRYPTARQKRVVKERDSRVRRLRGR